MKTEQFNLILEERIERIKSTLSNKAKEYAQEDRLHNFKYAAQINNTTPAKSLWGMSTKHLVSVIDLVEGRIDCSKDMINEKIGDMINYLILLECILKEECY